MRRLSCCEVSLESLSCLVKSEMRAAWAEYLDSYSVFLDSGDDDVVDHELLRKTSGRELRKRLRDKADNVERERKREVEQALLRNEKLV